MARRRFGRKAQNKNEVTVNENQDQEAVNGTANDGQTSSVENTESVPQNNQTEVETTPAPNEIAEKADNERPEEEVKFADESNPNQKARNAATDGAEVDQDGNPRTGGYSYGVAADDTSGTVADPQNQPDKDTKNVREASDSAEQSTVNTNINAEEKSVEDQFKLEQKLSDPKNGVVARVTTSLGDYVRVKYFYNNKPLGTYRSRNFKLADAQKHLKRLRKDRGV